MTLPPPTSSISYNIVSGAYFLIRDPAGGVGERKVDICPVDGGIRVTRPGGCGHFPPRSPDDHCSLLHKVDFFCGGKFFSLPQRRVFPIIPPLRGGFNYRESHLAAMCSEHRHIVTPRVCFFWTKKRHIGIRQNVCGVHFRCSRQTYNVFSVSIESNRSRCCAGNSLFYVPVLCILCVVLT